MTCLVCSYQPEFDHLSSPLIYSLGSRQAKYFPAIFTIIQCYESHWNATHHGVDCISVRRNRDWCRTSLKWNFFRESYLFLIHQFISGVTLRNNITMRWWLVKYASVCYMRSPPQRSSSRWTNGWGRYIVYPLCGLWQKRTSDDSDWPRRFHVHESTLIWRAYCY